MKIVAFDNKELLLYFGPYYVDECGKKCVNLFHPAMVAAAVEISFFFFFPELDELAQCGKNLKNSNCYFCLQLHFCNNQNYCNMSKDQKIHSKDKLNFNLKSLINDI